MKKIISILIIIFFALLLGFNALAVESTKDKPSSKPKSETIKLTNPLDPTGKSPVSPQDLIGKIINYILSIVGSLALVMFIYGGFTWMLAAGNSERVEKGKEIIIWATIGLIVIFSSYALVKFVINGIKA